MAKIVFDAVYRHHPVVLSQHILNLVGYVVSPVLAFVAMVCLFFVVEKVKCNSVSVVKYAFGFKVK